jgi:hypothetical protein
MPNCGPECSSDGDCAVPDDACKLGECVDGACTVKDALDCNAYASQCTTGRCYVNSSGDAACGAENKEGNCNDENACTSNDSCVEGICTSNTAVTCSGTFCQPKICDTTLGCVDGTPPNCPDKNQCTVGYCDGTSCEDNLTSKNGAPCEGGTAPKCKKYECSGGSCESVHIAGCSLCDGVTCDTNTACTLYSCDVADGICYPSHKTDATSCNADSDVCTVDDHCSGNGVCVPGGPMDCTASEDSCHSATCVSDGTCERTPHSEWAGCCSMDDDCDEDANQCLGKCLGGICDYTESKGDYTLCNDGLQCTSKNGSPQTGDWCLGGVCKGTGVSCPDASTCFDYLCNTGTGVCDATPTGGATCGDCTDQPNGYSCTDSNLCTMDDKCQAGVCIGTPMDCESAAYPALNTQCTKGVCSGGVCGSEDLPNTSTSCDDDNECTVDDYCYGGSCQAGSQMPCPGDDCRDGYCENGGCEYTPKNLAGSCTGDTFCSPKACSGAGTCIADTPPDCTSSNECIKGSCGVTSCVYDTSIENGEPCEGGTAPKCKKYECSGGSCLSVHIAGCSLCDDVTCNPDTACTTYSCNAATGLCDSTSKPVSQSCNDYNSCTVGDHCDGNGACVPAGPMDCTGSEDSCHSATCVSGTCERTPHPEWAGCCSMDDDCDEDANQCLGKCLGGICDYTENKVNYTYCNDGLQCTSKDGSPQTGDWCVDGVCVGDPVTCTGSGQCVTYSCETTDGSCDPHPTGHADCTNCDTAGNGTPCDDKDPCTTYNELGDICADGVCTGNRMDCSYLNDECKTYYCEPDEDDPTLPSCVPAPDCVYGEWCPETKQCLCHGGEDPSPGNGFCLDGNGRCTIYRTYHEPTRQYYCGSTPPQPPAPPSCTTHDDCSAMNNGCVAGECKSGKCELIPNCGFGDWDGEKCICRPANDPTSNGYCHDVTGSCTLARTWDQPTGQFYCGPYPPLPLPPTPTYCSNDEDCSGSNNGCVEGYCDDDSICKTRADCVFGEFNTVDGACNCIGGPYPSAGQGYCKDTAGACTIIKLYQNGLFVCPGSPPDPAGPEPDGGDDALAEPAGGCIFGSWNTATKKCDCVWGDFPSQVMGYCVDPASRTCCGTCYMQWKWKSDYSGGYYTCP